MAEIPERLSDILSTPTPPAYSVFLLARDGTVSNPVRVAAKDDADGREQARAMVDGHAVELWGGLRFIEHFPSIG
ncbi:hypothetical protein [Methylobacterium sp. WL9]|uniref:hypothetical protein n=1 Tax=Methylobacterium sp. WL9 TaxID=2603898 RepID=UPI0011C962AC|nr:hypothetical protein [Methylobacterium sp. WL9]TXN19420.1 hypothetical protein FV217_21440 [Methylobacterium sp. WL9]